MTEEEITGEAITEDQFKERRDDLTQAALAIQAFDQDNIEIEELRKHLKNWVWRGGG